MSKRNLVLASICGAAVAAPALAYGQGPPASATVDAKDNSPTDHVWAPADATILKGGTVTFRNAAGNDAHLLQFTDTVTPSCSGTPPYPKDDWQATCRFDATGTYHYVCPIHEHMDGTVTVQAAATPTPTPGGSATPTPTATPEPGGGGGGSPVTQTSVKVALPKAQKGARVRGAVDVELARSRLEVAVWARRSAVVGGKSTKLLRVGRWTVASTRAGKVSFAVAINAKARSALRRHRRLSVTVSVALTPPGGHKLTRSVKSTLRAG